MRIGASPVPPVDLAIARCERAFASRREAIILTTCIIASLLVLSPGAYAQEADLHLAITLAPTMVLSANPLRSVPRSDGGVRMTRLSEQLGFLAGLSVSSERIPLALRVAAGRTFGASVQRQEHRTISCGTSCTRTEAYYVYAGEGTSWLVTADIVLTPRLTWPIRPEVVVGLGRNAISYHSLADDLRPYFDKNDIAYVTRAGVGLAVALTSQWEASVHLLQQRGRGEDGHLAPTEFWPQKDIVFSATMLVRLK